MRHTQLDTRAIALLLLCCSLWGLNQVAAKVALDHIPPLAQAGARSCIAAVLVALWARWRGLSLSWRNGTLGGGLLAGTLFAAEFGCIFWGLQYTSASRLVVFVYLSPFVVALGMPLISADERLRPVQWAGLTLAFAGVAGAFAEGFHSPSVSPQQWLGDGLALLAAILWGATTLVIRGSRLSQASAEQTLFYQLAVSAVLLTGASALVGEAWPDWLNLPATPWLMLAFQGVIISFATYLLWFWLIRHYPATRLASFTLLTPLAGLWAGVALLDEPLTARLLIAGAAVAAGLLLINRPGPKARG
jgi:drug/metabolite transporter (DMT)-like permease